MKRLFNQCGRYRRSISLLASGALPERDRDAVENHLAACAGCRKYYEEIKSVSAPLAGWKRHFAHLEPTEAAGLRWARAIQSAAGSKPARRLTPGSLLLTMWRELIWPCRRAWAGMAALWLVMWGINSGLSNTPATAANAQAASAPAIWQTFEEQRRLLAELTQPLNLQLGEPPRPDKPRPRSERRTSWEIC